MSLYSVAREKTKAFELELAESIGRLDEAEEKITNVISSRRDW
jgi:hypothetical protein